MKIQVNQTRLSEELDELAAFFGDRTAGDYADRFLGAGSRGARVVERTVRGDWP